MNLKGKNAINIFTACSKSRTLVSIHFSGNNLDPESAKQVRKILKSTYMKHDDYS
jgi:hypothetical protein